MTKGILWEADPHTLAKIRIVEEYLKAWFPILARTSDHLLYVDGFSGPGKYLQGELGSPYIAVLTALKHRRNLQNATLDFVFIDRDPDRVAHLDGMLKRLTLPPQMSYDTITGTFSAALARTLDQIDSGMRRSGASFLFVDPFGVSGVPYSLLQRFMARPKAELLVTFMVESIERFAGTPEFEPHLDALYGIPEWRACLPLRDDMRRNCFSRLFHERLSELGKYVWTFQMRDERNKQIYILYFATNHPLGLERMKDAMWKIAPTGDFTFSDRTYNHVTLFENYFDPAHHAQLLVERFRGQAVPVEDVWTYTLTDTPYRRTNHCTKALKHLERTGTLEYVAGPRKRRFAYPEGSLLKFSG